jgi:hypothetical protein
LPFAKRRSKTQFQVEKRAPAKHWQGVWHPSRPVNRIPFINLHNLSLHQNPYLVLRFFLIDNIVRLLKYSPLEGWTAEGVLMLRTQRLSLVVRRSSHSAIMQKEVRDHISEHCEELLLRSKQLITRSREILTRFQHAKQRCKDSGLVQKRKIAKFHSRHTPRLNQENHNRQDSRV